MSSLVGCHNISLCKCEHVALRSSYSHTYMGDGCLLIGLLPSVTVHSHRTRRERQSGRKSVIFNEPAASSGEACFGR